VRADRIAVRMGLKRRAMHTRRLVRDINRLGEIQRECRLDGYRLGVHDATERIISAARELDYDNILAPPRHRIAVACNNLLGRLRDRYRAWRERRRGVRQAASASVPSCSDYKI